MNDVAVKNVLVDVTGDDIVVQYGLPGFGKGDISVKVSNDEEGCFIQLVPNLASKATDNKFTNSMIDSMKNGVCDCPCEPGDDSCPPIEWRGIHLPISNVDISKVDANLVDGLLTVRLVAIEAPHAMIQL